MSNTDIQGSHSNTAGAPPIEATPDTVSPAVIARQPARRRSRVRFEAIVAAAEGAFVEDQDLPSIPALAEMLGYTRASIYHFFPTPDALHNELIQRSFAGVAAAIEAEIALAGCAGWSAIIDRIVAAVIAFYASNPVARGLILQGPRNAEGFAVQEETSRAIGRSLREALRGGGLALPADPDVAWILVGLIDSMLRFSLLRSGEITDEMHREIGRMAHAYLGSYAHV